MFTMLPVMEMLPWFGITCWPTLLASMKETGERYNVLHFAKKNICTFAIRPPHPLPSQGWVVSPAFGSN